MDVGNDGMLNPRVQGCSDGKILCIRSTPHTNLTPTPSPRREEGVEMGGHRERREEQEGGERREEKKDRGRRRKKKKEREGRRDIPILSFIQ